MSHFFRHIALLVALALPMVATGAPVTKAQADTLYAHGRYAEAVTAYEQILATRGVSADLHYNLGNTYYKRGDIARAIVHYERALLLNPADEDTRANLTFVRSKTVDKVVPPSQLFFVTWWNALTSLLPLDVWAVMGVAAFLLALLGALLHFFCRTAWGAWPLRVGLCALAVCVLSNLCAYTQHRNMTCHDAAILIAPSAPVKSSPDASSTTLFVIHAGARLDILDATVPRWTKVRLEEGKQGWIPSAIAEVI